MILYLELLGVGPVKKNTLYVNYLIFRLLFSFSVCMGLLFTSLLRHIDQEMIGLQSRRYITKQASQLPTFIERATVRGHAQYFFLEINISG